MSELAAVVAAIVFSPTIVNALLLVADALIYFAVLAALFRARYRIGIGAFFCALGVMHFLETYLASIFSDRRSQAQAALEVLSASTFAVVSGAYFDSRSRESQALLSILDVELVDSVKQEVRCNDNHLGRRIDS